MKSTRISLAPAFLLHQMPWRDSSRILEFLSRDYGRISLFARGVRRERSEARPLLQPFQRLLISWSGRGEAGTLVGVERDGAWTVLPSAQVISGFYMNELLLKLLARHDAHPQLFDDYSTALQALRQWQCTCTCFADLRKTPAAVAGVVARLRAGDDQRHALAGRALLLFSTRPRAGARGGRGSGHVSRCIASVARRGTARGSGESAGCTACVARRARCLPGRTQPQEP